MIFKKNEKMQLQKLEEGERGREREREREREGGENLVGQFYCIVLFFSICAIH
jgi:hypothetical protein